MIWSEESLERLNELVKKKLASLTAAITMGRSPIPTYDARRDNWHNYCMSVGIEMNIIPDYETETRPDLPPPGEAVLLNDGTIRIRNVWGDKYIDMPEEFAFRALSLGFLP